MVLTKTKYGFELSKKVNGKTIREAKRKSLEKIMKYIEIKNISVINKINE